MKLQRSMQRIFFTLVLTLTAFPIANTALMGNHAIIPSVHGANSNNLVGINCALGTLDPVTGASFSGRDGNGTIEKTCQWAGDSDGDGPTVESGAEPLVTDPAPLNPASPCILAPCGAPGGGGFEADVVIANMNDSINGFDLSLGFDPHILNAVQVDQVGLEFGGNAGCNSCTLTAASSIDNTLGIVRVAQALLSISAGTVGGELTLFRVRFDVVGAGSAALTIGGVNIITHIVGGGVARALPHTDIPGLFSTSVFFDSLVNGLSYPQSLGFNASWTISPNPAVPGSPLTFVATAACKICTGVLTYKWAFHTAEGIVPVFTATGSAVTVSSSTSPIDRVMLVVFDSATPTPNNVTATMRLPLAAAMQGNGNPILAQVRSPTKIQGLWLGGVPPYTARWRLCPGSATATVVCSNPSPTLASTTAESANQTVTYNFAGLYTDSLTVTDSSPIWQQSSAAQSSIQVNATGKPAAFGVVLNATGGPASFSFTTSVLYNSTYPVAFRSSAFSFTFNFGDGTTLTSSTGTVSHLFTTSGTFIVSVAVREQSNQASSQIVEVGHAIVTSTSGFDYSLSLNPNFSQVKAGGATTTSQVSVSTLTGTAQNVKIGASFSVIGVSVSFLPTSGVSPFTSTMTVSTTGSTPAGIYVITVVANSTSGVVHSTPFSLTVGATRTGLPIVGIWSSACSSFNITLSSCPSGTGLGVGSTFSVQINVTNARPFNAFETALYYDPTTLNATSIDLVTNTVWTNPFPVVRDTSYPGEVIVSMTNLGPTPITSDGILASISFTVKASGVSPLTLAAGMAQPSLNAVSQSGVKVDWTRFALGGTPFEAGTADGYFMNQATKRGPVASFTYSPVQSFVGQTVTFNAKQSYDLDNPALGTRGIIFYFWDFGDGFSIGPSNQTVIQHVFGGNSYATPFQGNFSVRLTVVDKDDGFLGMMTQRVYIAPPPVHDVAINNLSAFPSSINVGGIIGVTVSLLNKGSFTENFNLSVTYSVPPILLAFTQGTLLPAQFAQYQYSLNTTGLSPGSYQITAKVGIPIANVTSDETQSVIFTVTIPTPLHDVRLFSIYVSNQFAVSGQTVSFELGVQNTGSAASTIDLVVYYNKTVAATLKGVTVQSGSFFQYFYPAWNTAGVPAGNYTISASAILSSDPTPEDNSITDGIVTILPPPTVSLTPNLGPVGTTVTIHVTGLPGGSANQPFTEFDVTFDNQFVGFSIPSGTSFVFTFNVPVAQPGLHTVHVVTVFPSLDLQTSFNVTASPASVNVGVSTGVIYFPGDTVNIRIVTSINGLPMAVTSLQTVLIKADGSNITLSSLPAGTGLYQATYAIPKTGLIGTYTILVKAHLTGSTDGLALTTFEVKLSWLSSQSRTITAGVAITGLVGVAMVAWRKGYFKRKTEESDF